LPADARYRSYLQLLNRQTEAELLVQPDAAPGDDPLAMAFSSAGNEDALTGLFGVDAETELPDLLMLTDKMSMAVSLEWGVPLLDHELVEILRRPCPTQSRCAAAV